MPSILQNRLVWVAAAVLFLIVGWLVLSIFIQQGRITITATPPYTLRVDQSTEIHCNQEQCSASVSPGRHTIELIKDGYREITETVEVSLGQEVKREVDFVFIPVIREEIGMTMPTYTTPRNSWQQQALNELRQKLPVQTPLFFEDEYVIYFQAHTTTGQQALYAQDDTNQPQLVTVFPRDLKRYQIIPALAQHNTVAVIDHSYDRFSLYLIDNELKSRQLIAENPYISGAKWMDNGNLIFEARGAQIILPELFIYQKASKTLQRLTLTTELNQVVPFKDRFIIATHALLDNQVPQESQLGQLVTPQPPLVPDPALPVSILEYNPTDDTYRLVMIAPFSSGVEDMVVEEDGSVLIGSGGKVYRLVLG